MKTAGRQPDQRLADPVFVEGIGPPLSQIREDYMLLLPEQPARDVIALIDAYLLFRAELAALEQQLQDAEAERDEAWASAAIDLNKRLEAERRLEAEAKP